MKRKRPPRRTIDERCGDLDDLYDYARPGPPRAGRKPKAAPEFVVTDDWPERVPVTEAEIDVFERWFGDLFDEMFGPTR